MKHDWEPTGTFNKKYLQATCALCGESCCAHADFADGIKIAKFWEELEKRKDCNGK